MINRCYSLVRMGHRFLRLLKPVTKVFVRFLICFNHGESNVVGNKVVWIRYRRLPLSLSIVDCFRKILGNVGTLVDMDEAATLNWECVEFARLKVRATIASKVQICEEVWINDRVYQITVEEESSFVECVKSRCWYKEDEISDTSSTLETRVSDSLKSGDEGRENSDNEGLMEEATVNDRRREKIDFHVSLEVGQRSCEVDQIFL